MSKKSYKRNQNRLYREIKRRIVAEQTAKFPVPVKEIHRDIETLAIKNVVRCCYFPNEIELVKTEMANKLARKLVAERQIRGMSAVVGLCWDKGEMQRRHSGRYFSDERTGRIRFRSIFMAR